FHKRCERMSARVSDFFGTHYTQVIDALAGIIILFVVFLRILPSLLIGAPFLPDPWVHIGKADSLLQTGHFFIWGDYDDHWPGVNILIALFRLFPGFDPVIVGQLVVPLLTGLSLVFFYLLVRHLTGNQVIAVVSLLLLGFAAPLTLIMGTTYKEGLARLFLMAALFAFVARSERDVWHVVPVVVLVGAIIPTHHISFLVAGSVIVFVMVSQQVFLLREGVLSWLKWGVQTSAYLLVLVVALTYYLVFGAYSLLLLDARILATVLVGYFVVFGALNLRRISLTKSSMTFKLLLLVLGLVLLGVFVAGIMLVPAFELTMLPLDTVLWLSPLAGLVLLGAFGYSVLDEVAPKLRIFLSSWILALLGLLLLALVSGRSALSLILTYRLVLFSFAPLCALAGVGVFGYVVTHPRQTRIMQVLLLVTLLAVLPVVTLGFTRDSFFGYGCSVTLPIQQSNNWIADYTEPTHTVVGDHLFTYYLLYYRDEPASVDLGYQLLVEGDLSTAYSLVGVHRYLWDNGFWLQSGVQWVPLHPRVIPWLEESAANGLIFNNGVVQIYRRI
ncbi:MAG: hypothetical protein ACFFCF_11740, partial [Promethearchaeota archaeon]